MPFGIDEPQPNGPRAKARRGRNRNTTVNNNSRVKNAGRGTVTGGGRIPLLRPTDVVSINQQLQGLETGKADALAALALQRAQARYGFRTARADIRDARRQGIQEVSMDALERGISGSTVDWHQRMGVKADAAKELQRAEHERSQALAANLLARLQTRRDYTLGVQNVAMTKSAMQQEANIDRFANDQVMGLGVAPPPGPTAADYGFNLATGRNNNSSGGGSNEVAQQERQVLQQIDTLMQQIRSTPQTKPNGDPTNARGPLIQQLYDLWEQRNKLLVQAGLQPYRRRILTRRLRRIGG